MLQPDDSLGIIKSRNFLDNNESWFRRKGRELFDYLVSRAKFGGIKGNENWRNRYNKDLMQLFGNFDIPSYVGTASVV